MQKADKVFYKGDEYFLTGLDGINLPIPTTFWKVSLAGGATNCRRGYTATYQITDSLLVVNFDVFAESHHDLPCKFTGGMLVGKDFADGHLGLFREYGYPKPVGFQTVLELIFIAGTLKRVYDRSELAAQMRARFAEYDSGG